MRPFVFWTISIFTLLSVSCNLSQQTSQYLEGPHTVSFFVEKTGDFDSLEVELIIGTPVASSWDRQYVKLGKVVLSDIPTSKSYQVQFKSVTDSWGSSRGSILNVNVSGYARFKNIYPPTGGYDICTATIRLSVDEELKKTFTITNGSNDNPKVSDYLSTVDL